MGRELCLVKTSAKWTIKNFPSILNMFPHAMFSEERYYCRTGVLFQEEKVRKVAFHP